MGNFKTSPKRQVVGKVGNPDVDKSNDKVDRIRKLEVEDGRRGIMTDRTPEHSPYFEDKLNQRMRNPFLTDR